MMARRKPIRDIKPTSKKKIKQNLNKQKKLKAYKAGPEASTLMNLGIYVKEEKIAKKILQEIFKEAKEKNQPIDLVAKRFREKYKK